MALDEKIHVMLTPLELMAHQYVTDTTPSSMGGALAGWPAHRLSTSR